jgi:hypothetical protein
MSISAIIIRPSGRCTKTRPTDWSIPPPFIWAKLKGNSLNCYANNWEMALIPSTSAIPSEKPLTFLFSSQRSSLNSEMSIHTEMHIIVWLEMQGQWPILVNGAPEEWTSKTSKDSPGPPPLLTLKLPSKKLRTLSKQLPEENQACWYTSHCKAREEWICLLQAT